MSLTAPFAVATNRVRASVQAAGQSVLVYALIGVLALLGAGFLIAALYIWLASVTDVLAAALLMGTGFLAIAGIWLAIVMSQANRRRQERRRTAADSAVLASTLSLASAGLRLASRSRGSLVWTALAAIAAGWYFGRSGDDAD